MGSGQELGEDALETGFDLDAVGFDNAELAGRAVAGELDDLIRDPVVAPGGVDIGIVVRDAPAELRFYHDVLGRENVGETAALGVGTVQRLKCGSSTIKPVSDPRNPQLSNPPGGLPVATGLLYWTISVSNLEDVLRDCAAAGRAIPVPITEVRPGVFIAMVEDQTATGLNCSEST